MTNINTGNNKPKGKRILKEKLIELVKQRGAVFIPPPIGDASGRTCCYKLKSRYAFLFYLVARSTKPFGPERLVSTQTFLLKRIAKGNFPLVMYIEDTETGFYVFDARTCLKVSYGENRRLKVPMTNYPVDIGYPWPKTHKTSDTLHVIWRQARRWRNQQ